ncbi:PepSY-like domain-containing protein [uncultured Fibrella sp.]|uniref:PepSY-like domain-containing protein n=1 Tax=uncultured Fibrella sp. TaxID=1284596 RepID=UPI0035C9F005
MKKISLLLPLLAVLWLGACRQQEAQPANEFPDVPTAVVQAVRIAYPTATGLSFTEIDKGNMWESDFSIQAVNHQATVNAKGSILEVYALGKGDALTGPQSVTLPAAAKAYIDKTYPGYKLVAVGEGQYNNQKAYKVSLRTEKEEVTLIFDASGTVILEFKAAITPVVEPPKTFPILKAEELPTAASNYLKENSLVFAKGMATVDKDNKKTYLVYATKGTTTYELAFDNDGKLIRSSSSTPTPPATTTVELKSISDLPAAAVAFLAGYTFEKGSVTTKEGKKTYSVVVNKDGKRYEMTFDGDGKVLTNTYTPRPTEKAMATSSELPGTSREYLTKTYPGWAFMKGVIVSTGSVVTSYTVVIKVGEVLYTVIFNGEGKFTSATRG